jgi:hypothetical protein
MSDLVEFLRARLDEDEQAARATSDGAWFTQRTLETNLSAAVADAAFIARSTPKRMLAEVEAKRRMLTDLYPEIKADGETILGEWGDDPCDRDMVLYLLALPYADHPDYRDEWRP